MDRSIKCVEESFVGIWRKIDRDFRTGRYCTCDLNVEHDFAICILGWTIGFVVCAAYRDCYNLWFFDSEAFEISCQIFCTKPSAELDNRDALAAPVEI